MLKKRENIAPFMGYGQRDKMKVGEEIPDFELEAYHEGEIKKLRLNDFRGKWLVIAFYPADFTFVCPTELEELAEKIKGDKVTVVVDPQSAQLREISVPVGANRLDGNALGVL